MPEPSGREPLAEWRALIDSAISSMQSVTGRSPLPRELLATMQRQLELGQDLVDRERRLQRELTRRFTAPVDAAFDLLEETAATLGRQAEALEAAGRALEETAGLMRRQAELFERAVGTLRQPADFAKAVAGLERKPTKGGGRTTRKSGGPATRKSGGPTSRKSSGPTSRKTR